MASEVPEDNYIVTYQAEEITDIDALLDMAVEQQTNQISAFSINGEQTEQNTNIVKQKLQTRLYTDGSEISDYVIIALSSPVDDSLPNIYAQNNISLTFRLYYSYYFAGSSGALYYAKPQKSIVNLLSKGTSDTVKLVQSCQAAEQGGSKLWKNTTTTGNAQVNSSYTVVPPSTSNGFALPFVLIGDNGNVRADCDIYRNGNFLYKLSIDILYFMENGTVQN